MYVYACGRELIRGLLLIPGARRGIPICAYQSALYHKQRWYFLLQCITTVAPMKFYPLLLLAVSVWANEEPHQQQRSMAIANSFCSSSCSGQYSQTIHLRGPCQETALNFFCKTSEYTARSKAKASCGYGSSYPRCFCDGVVSQNYCDMKAYNTSLPLNNPMSMCQYKVYKVFEGNCSKATQTSAFIDSLCAGTHEMIGSISTPNCYAGSSDVQAFCNISADASRYKADTQCNPNSDVPQVSTCQGDYTISKCTAAIEEGGNCTVATSLQFQGYCGTTESSQPPATSPASSPSSEGLVLKKIHGHKIAVFVTRRLPKNLLFRAVRHITESKDLTGNDWSSYYLGNYTVPYYRPDIGRKIPAYYEFEIFSDPGLRKPAGFIILTSSDPTAKQDNPVAHWNSHGPSMTKQLLSDAKQSNDSVNTARTVLWKLDSLSYVASKGPVLISQIGNIPPVIKGLTQDIFNQFSSPDKNSQVVDMPYLDPSVYPTATSSIPDDGQFKQLLLNRTQSGPDKSSIPFTFEQSTNFSFGDYISSYTENFQFHIDMLRTSVTRKWIYEDRGYQICDLTAQPTYANEFVNDDCVDTAYIPVPADSYRSPITIPFLDAVLVTVQDPNRIFYQDAQFYKPTGQQYPVLVLSTNSLPMDLSNVTKDELSATASVSIGEKVVLRITFYLVANSYTIAPPSWIVNSPTSANGGRRLQHYVWNYYWAGTGSQQRCYDQYTYGSCQVGCGPVAWMMLFGWVDFLSSPLGGNVYGRNCAYHSGGVSAGSCTANPSGIAPSANDASVKNSINNIRNRVGTFCAFGSGATAPWDMPGAINYLHEMGTGLGTRVNWNSVGYHSHSLTSRAAEEIVWYQRPSIIGTGWLTHYPLAYGYAWQSRPGGLFQPDTVYDESFYINTGWGCRGNGWVGSGTWFAGRATP